MKEGRRRKTNDTGSTARFVRAVRVSVSWKEEAGEWSESGQEKEIKDWLTRSIGKVQFENDEKRKSTWRVLDDQWSESERNQVQVKTKRTGCVGRWKWRTWDTQKGWADTKRATGAAIRLVLVPYEITHWSSGLVQRKCVSDLYESNRISGRHQRESEVKCKAEAIGCAVFRFERCVVNLGPITHTHTRHRRLNQKEDEEDGNWINKLIRRRRRWWKRLKPKLVHKREPTKVTEFISNCGRYDELETKEKVKKRKRLCEKMAELDQTCRH